MSVAEAVYKASASAPQPALERYIDAPIMVYSHRIARAKTPRNYVICNIFISAPKFAFRQCVHVGIQLSDYQFMPSVISVGA